MNALTAAGVAVYSLALAHFSLAQPRVDPRNMYERCIAVVPLVGSGTPADPKRPMYAPAPREINPTSRTGIIGFTYVLSDNGNRALVEYVARDRAAFRQILADRSVQAFVKGVSRRGDVEAALKQHKKDFDLNTFGVRVP